ncbi:MAG TPA: ChbG/HpnK family deacetylase [Terriglobales bacterium]|nr:ChbG/HpnK family deacetylase [Terriglobales bacterium]
MRRLIINADDFGLTSGVNRAIVEAHQQGVVTSTTLMATGRAFSDAAQQSHTLPKLSVGCHVVLVDGQPTCRPEQVRSLLMPSRREGLPFSPVRDGHMRTVAATAAPTARFYDGFGQLALLSVKGRVHSDQVQAEAGSQIECLQHAGINVSHVDAHKHTHMLPQVADAIMRAARDRGIRAIRNPFVPLRIVIFSHVLRRPKLWKRYFETTMLRKYHHAFRERVKRNGMITPDGSFGVISTGIMDDDLFSAIVGSIPEGTWELVCHPGYNDAELGLVHTRLRESRARELAVFLSPRSRQALADHNIELISYHDFANQFANQ